MAMEKNHGGLLKTCARALLVATAKDMAACKEATEAKWIQMAAKLTRTF
jgi:hypothetical protein